jgi:hypothetical protein
MLLDRNHHQLLPGIGYRRQSWDPAKLPEYVEICALCDGAGIYEQTYSAGCGMGYYRANGECEWCKGLGIRYARSDSYRDPVLPASVLAQCLNAQRDA